MGTNVLHEDPSNFAGTANVAKVDLMRKTSYVVIPDVPLSNSQTAHWIQEIQSAKVEIQEGNFDTFQDVFGD